MNDPVLSQGASEGMSVPASQRPQYAPSAPAKLPRVLAQHPTSEAAPKPPLSIVTLPRFCGRGYAARLQRRGFEVIGHGGGFGFDATLVLAKPGSDRVVKVGMFPSGDPYPHYAAWCIRNPGPFRPVIHHLSWHGKGLSRFFVVTMDRLEALDWKDHQPLNHAIDRWYAGMFAAGYNYWGFNHRRTDPRWAKRLVKGLRRHDLKPLAGFVGGLATAFPSYMLDPQTSNWLLDSKGRLILIDPFSRLNWSLPETASRLLKA